MTIFLVFLILSRLEDRLDHKQIKQEVPVSPPKDV